jgi:adenine-specific DNA methylase
MYQGYKDKQRRQQYLKEYRENNRGKLAKYNRQYRKENQEKLLEYSKEYQQKNNTYWLWQKERNCKRCNKIFMPKYNWQLYCCSACRIKYNYIHYKREYNKAYSLKRRFEIFQRDNFTCQYCGRKPPEVILEVDHYLIPKSKSGKWHKDNLITSCKDCNLGKSDVILSNRLSANNLSWDNH